METMLTNEVAKQVKEVFGHLEGAVRVLAFVGENEHHGTQAVKLLEEVTELSEKLDLQVYKIEQNWELAGSYNVDKTPTLVLLSQEDSIWVDKGVRILGAPGGHEFTALIYGLLGVSKEGSDLKSETITFLEELEQPVHLRVFSTPT